MTTETVSDGRVHDPPAGVAERSDHAAAYGVAFTPRNTAAAAMAMKIGPRPDELAGRHNCTYRRQAPIIGSRSVPAPALAARRDRW